MKKIKLFLAACAAMVTMGVNAQSWTAPTVQGEDPVSGGKYTIQNVGSGMFLNGGKAWFSWSTTAILANTGLEFTFTGDASSFKLTSSKGGFFTSGNNISGDAMHVDGTAGAYGLTKLANNNYHIHDAGGNESSLCWGYGTPSGQTLAGVVAHADATNTGWQCEWAFIGENSAALYNARLALYNWYLDATANGVSTDAYADAYTNGTVAEVNAAATSLKKNILDALLPTASNNNPVDITKYVLNNADFSAGNILGWETNYVAGQQAQNIGYQGASYTNGSVTINQFIEAWRPGAALGDGYLRQTVSGLPEGKFVLEADGISVWQNDASRTVTGSQLYITADGVDYKKDMSTANNKPEHFSVEFLNTGEGDVIFGLRTVNSNGNWLCADNFKVTFYGIDLSEYETQLAAAVAEAGAVDESTTSAAAYAALQTALSTYNKTWSSSKEYATAIAAIQDATKAANAVAVAIVKYNAKKATMQAVSNTIDFSQPDAVVAAATTADEVDVATASLSPLFKNYLATVEDQEIDVTSVLLVNAGFEEGNLNGWTSDGTQTPGAQGNKAFDNVQGEMYCERWHAAGTINIYQELTDMPAGYYELSAYAYTSADAGSLYLNGESVSFTTSALYTVELKMENAGTLKLGLTGAVTESSWLCMDAFTLKYLGSNPISGFRTAYEEALAAANTAKSAAANANVTGSELTALNEAIAATPETTIDGYKAAAATLTAATSAFTAAAPAYDKYAAYKAETIALWETDFDVTAPTTAAGAAVAVQNLNVAQYNKVATDYPYSLTSKIGDFSTWTGTAEVGTPRVAGTPNSLDWEHWSGTTHPYYEQDGSGYGNDGGWTIQYTKTTTLPAGSYVVKVAARSSAGVTSSITIMDKNNKIAPVISLPCTGNRARGIAKDGTASWDDSKEYILENQGGGWEWRFVPFTLSAETEVTMIFYAEASTGAQWMSIGDGELLSTQNVATAVTYADNVDNNIEDFDLANVTITRTIKDGFNTVCLPFDLTIADVQAAFGTGTQVYAFSENSDDPMNVTINFTTVNAGTISANVPVLVKATTASNKQVFNGVQVVAATDAKVEGKNFNFVGLYAPLDPIPAGDYFIGNGAIYKSAGATSMKAFRAYIKAKTTGSEVKMYIDGLETAISEINADAQENGVIYNLAGQRVNKAQKGIYIQNGKKVLVK